MPVKQKEFLAYGIAGLPSIAEFFDRSTLGADDKVVLTAIHDLPMYAYPLTDLWHLQNERAELAKRAGDQVAAMALHRQNLHLLNQAESAGEPLGSRSAVVMAGDRVKTLESLRMLGVEAGDAGIGKHESLDHQLARAKSEFALLVRRPNSFDDDPSVALGLFAVWSMAAAVFLLGAGSIAWLAARGLHGGAIPKLPLGVAQHAVCWFLAFIASFFVLGTWPAEIVSKRVQSWVITTATVLVTLGVLFWICWLRRFRFTLRAVFKLTFCFSVLFAVLAWLRTRTHAFDMFPPELWVPAKHFDLWADVLGVQYGAAKHSWGAAAVQWLGYCGPFVTGWLGLGLVGTWCAARAAIVARKAGASTNTLSSRAFWSDCFASAGRWSWAPGLACLVVYLSIAPRYFQSADSHHVSVIGNLRNPWPEWQAIQKALAQLSTDNQRDPENGVD